MRDFSLIAALIALLATTVVLAQEEPAPPMTAVEPAAAPEADGRTNPFAPLAGDAEGAARPNAEPQASTPSLSAAPGPGPAGESSAPARLNGILYCEPRPLAVISDVIVGPGDEVRGMRVLKIERDRVLLAGPGGTLAMTPLRPEAHAAPPEPAAADRPEPTAATPATGPGDESAAAADATQTGEVAADPMAPPDPEKENP